MNKPSKRSKAREQGFKLLYSMQFNKEDNLENQIKDFEEQEKIETESSKEYIEDLILGIFKNKENIDKEISKNLKPGWSISRIYKVDLSLLEIGVYEIFYSKIPYKAVINEVINLSKKYGSENSKNFINGILASLVDEYGLDKTDEDEEDTVE